MTSAPFSPAAALHPRDRIGIIAPASGFERAAFDAGVAVLASRYQPDYSDGLFARHRYLAGDDDRRMGELLGAFADPGVRAIFCARGGYGATRLLSRLAGIAPAGARRLLVGFSDITALHLWLQSHGWIGIHGPVVTQLGRLPRATHERLFHLLESSSPAPDLVGTDTYVPGVAEGRLIGGNLSVLSRVIGTPFMPDLEGAILLLEDFGERPYRLDRMWTHLALAGVFARVRGIVLGTFTQCEEKDAPYSSGDLLRELAAVTGKPCAAGFPIGHGDMNEPVALGIRVRLDASARRLTFLEGAVA